MPPAARTDQPRPAAALAFAASPDEENHRPMAPPIATQSIVACGVMSHGLDHASVAE
jgi:hypothetical protein